MKLRIVVAYCPHDSGGDRSVYGQHRFWFNRNNAPRVPREAFWKDLLDEVKKWLAAGDQLVLMGDWNEDVAAVQQKYLGPLGLTERLTEAYGPVPTYQRGSKAIDGIFLSRSLQMKQGGYLAFGEAILSDHRALWLDITFINAFGHKMPPIVRAPARRLTCNDPRVRNKFVASYESFVKQHKLAEHAQRLRESVTYPLSQAAKKTYEWLDRMRLAGIRRAEHACRKLRMGAVALCGDTKKAWLLIESWSLLLKKKKELKVSSRKLKRTMLQAGLNLVSGLTVKLCEDKLKEARQNYLKVKRNSMQGRDTWLKGLADAKAAEGNTKAAKEYERLRRQEAQRRTSRKTKYLRGKLRAGGVTFVQRQEADGSLTEVADKRQLEHLLAATHEGKYRASEDTPMMQSPLLDDFGYLGIGTPAAQQVMDGSYEAPEGTNEYARRLLHQLAMSDLAVAADEAPEGIPVEVWRKFWRKAKERTASGPSDINFSVLKAGAHSDLISSFDAWMTEIPMLSGYSPSHWRKAIDAVLVKRRLDSFW